jgi:hypothetical protein
MILAGADETAALEQAAGADVTVADVLDRQEVDIAE